MSVKLKLNLPSSVWTAQDSSILALNTLASIKLRTSKGISSENKKFKEYSTNPLYVSFKGARLKPKGGVKSSTGDSVFYQDGYKQYKHDSRKRGKSSKSAEVDLVLSGQLMNNLVVLEATNTGFKIGLTKHVRHYGYDVNLERPFIGLTKKDTQILIDSVAIDIKNKLEAKR
tara:strand:+ start:12460 stop:12975 length:516 start_codon:yes stop_codon:yes gene_type:complete